MGYGVSSPVTNTVDTADCDGRSTTVLQRAGSSSDSVLINDNSPNLYHLHQNLRHLGGQ